MTSTDVLKVLAKKHADDFFITECKNGPTCYGSHLRMDAVAIKKSWANPCIIVYEVKVSHSDFVSDSKWPSYLKYCNRFYFACPEGLIKKTELPDGVGLIYVKEDGTARTVKAPPFRSIKVEADFYQYILFSKLDPDRLPFYSERKEYIKDWIENKKENRTIGYMFRGYMVKEIERLQGELNKFKHIREIKQNYDAVMEVMEKHGLSTWYEPEKTLDKALTMTYPKELDAIFSQLQVAISQIEKIKTSTA